MITLKNTLINQKYLPKPVKYIFILFLIGGFILSGCGGGEDDPAPNSPNTPGSANDTTAPEVVSITPSNGSTDIPVEVAIQITLSESVDIETIKTGTVILSGGAASNLAWNWQMTGTSVTLTPDDPLENGVEYLLRITTGVKDLAGNSFDQTFSSRFTTEQGDFVDVVTNNVSEITEQSAVLNGEFSTNISVSQKGFVYANGTTTPTINDNRINVSAGSGSGFSFELTGLNSSVTYSARAFTESSLGVVYGNVKTFTTLSTPTVQTKVAEGVINRSGFVGGQIDTKGRDLDRYGIVWSLSANPDLNSNVIESSGNESDFTEEIKDRDVNQAIYYKAFAVTSGTGLVVFGPEKTFTTLNIKAGNIMSLRYSSLDSRTIIGEMKVDGVINGNYTWVEINSDGTFIFEETNFDEWSNYLYDAGRNVNVQLGLFAGSVFRRFSDGSRTELYKIREMYVNDDFTNAASPPGRKEER